VLPHPVASGRGLALAAALLLGGAACAAPPPAPMATPTPLPPTSAPTALPTAPPTPRPPTATPAPPPTATPVPPPRPLALGDQPFAVVVDNLPDARPHSGLAEAAVVYEAPAEAGIPRLLAVFAADAEPARVGPVRSARHYFVQLAAEHGAPLVHVGSSPQGFAALRALGLPDVDEVAGGAAFARDRARPAPHNAYVSAAGVRAELGPPGEPGPEAPGGLLVGAFAPGPAPATRLRVAYPCCVGFEAEYTYEPAARRYARAMDGQPHADADTGAPYTAAAVVVQRVPVEAIAGDAQGRLDVGLVGAGDGLLVAEGTAVELRWAKAGPAAPTRYERLDGQPFALPAGPVWVEVLPTDATVEAD
jgi:hypothetical protein